MVSFSRGLYLGAWAGEAMNVVANGTGFVMVFDNDKDLANVIKNLRNLRKNKRNRKWGSYPAALLTYEPVNDDKAALKVLSRAKRVAKR